ncbi:MAG: isoprenoid biosynthesis glyoxalase ElbB [Cyanobacteria bacterium]|nr:isoprenoid biosynthesis glyoxalase ElbB [Cyanobacteriota bacterium]MDA1020189.1 isoprenoid biosynthesis glyoxalase ElbB [Cyanobacteriota bacterium]
MSKKILVVLAGCGAKDGAEIHESVLTLLAIDKAGAKYYCAAPNKKQHHVLNFIDDTEMPEERNVMIESARISRGKIFDLSQITMKDYDAVIFPGGFGVAKNLCSFALDGADASIDPDAKRIIQEAYDARKPIGAICVSPALIALALAEKNPNRHPAKQSFASDVDTKEVGTMQSMCSANEDKADSQRRSEIVLTLGTDEGTNKVLESIGVKSQSCLTTSFIKDDANLIACSPAYMHGSSSISELEQGISQCVNAVIEMTQSKVTN